MQMLLDKYVITKGLESLLSHSPTVSGPPPAGFTKRLHTSLSRIDPLLKTLQVRPAPAEGLVQAYLIHIADRSETNFKKMLELKGIRKQDWPHLVELFGAFKEGKSGGELVASSNLLAPLQIGIGVTHGGGIGSLGGYNPANAIGGSSGLPARFDPSTIGEKLFSAARDRVEQIGGVQSPVLGGTAAGTREGSVDRGGREGSVERETEKEKANTVNENLRNFGKFFRRDMSGFGGRFGGGSKGADDTVR